MQLSQIRTLSDHHRALLHARALTDEAIAARGYFTSKSRTELRGLGFSETQARLADAGPVLVIPLWNVTGQQDGYQLRPDVPLPDSKRDGKPRKYENLSGRPNNLDVPPGSIALRETDVPLYVTESALKGDALASTGAKAVVSMPGVYGWRGDDAQAAVDSLPWKGRKVYLIPDSDSQSNKAVRAAIWRFGNLIEHMGALPAFVQLPHAADGTKQGVDDWLAQRHRLEELDGLILANVVLFSGPSIVDGRQLPKITVHEHLRDLVDASMAALVTSNDPPRLFARGGEAVEIIADESGREHIRAVTSGGMAVHLSRAADYVRIGETAEIKVPPPRQVVEGVMAECGSKLPGLTYISTAPILRPDGSIVVERGYDPITKAFCVPAKGLEDLDIPDDPTPEDRAAALALIDDALADFPFADEASKAHALALVVTLVARPCFEGPSPFFLIDKPTPGSGSGVLMDTVAVIATGTTARVSTYTNDDAEMRKRLTALFTGGAGLINFDNIAAALKSPELSAAVTCRYWQDRILGVGRVGEWPNMATFCGTGNNVRLGGDFPRRVAPIRLNPTVARPWTRPATDFRHPHLVRYVFDHRGELLAATLTVCKAWIRAGRPLVDTPPFGSFEDWSATIGGILAHAGVPGFLGNLTQFWDDADEAAAKWEAFLGQWSEILGTAPQTAATVAESITAQAARWGEALPDWPGEDKLGLARRVGYGLRANKDRRFGRFALEKAEGGHAGTARWIVVVAPPPPTDGGDDAPESAITTNHHHDHHQAESDTDGGDGGDVSRPLRTCAEGRVCARTRPCARVEVNQCPPSPPSPPTAPGDLVEIEAPASAGWRCPAHQLSRVFRPRPDAPWLCRSCGAVAVEGVP